MVILKQLFRLQDAGTKKWSNNQRVTAQTVLKDELTEISIIVIYLVCIYTYTHTCKGKLFSWHGCAQQWQWAIKPECDRAVGQSHIKKQERLLPRCQLRCSSWGTKGARNERLSRPPRLWAQLSLFYGRVEDVLPWLLRESCLWKAFSIWGSESLATLSPGTPWLHSRE